MNKEPGWDAKAIKRIVHNHYDGSYGRLFERHGWPERGQALMVSAPKHIVASYGSIAHFVKSHEKHK